MHINQFNWITHNIDSVQLCYVILVTVQFFLNDISTTTSSTTSTKVVFIHNIDESSFYPQHRYESKFTR